MPGRNRKQVCERYANFLKKERSPHDFTLAEDTVIINCIQTYGRKWHRISDQLPGRTPIMIKNRYYSRLRHLCKPPSSDSTLVHPTSNPPIIDSPDDSLVQSGPEAELPVQKQEPQKDPEGNLPERILQEEAKCLEYPLAEVESVPKLTLKPTHKPNQGAKNKTMSEREILKRQATQLQASLKALNEDIRKLQAQLST